MFCLMVDSFGGILVNGSCKGSILFGLFLDIVSFYKSDVLKIC